MFIIIFVDYPSKIWMQTQCTVKCKICSHFFFYRRCYVLPIISLVKSFKETLICDGIDHEIFQRLRGTRSCAVEAQYRHAQCTVDIPTFLSPTSQKNAYAATAAIHLINACVVGISKSNKGKSPWFRTKESVSLS